MCLLSQYCKLMNADSRVIVCRYRASKSCPTFDEIEDLFVEITQYSVVQIPRAMELEVQISSLCMCFGEFCEFFKLLLA